MTINQLQEKTKKYALTGEYEQTPYDRELETLAIERDKLYWQCRECGIRKIRITHYVQSICGLCKDFGGIIE